ncbi:Leo1-like protein [Suhomyces tanzawaensis NRRL Y-17324]
MSDEESLHRISDDESKNDVDDLFGDSEVEDQPNEQNRQLEPAEEEEQDEDEEEDEDELKTIDLSLPRHAINQKPEQDTYMLKMPVFLNVEAHPFDPNEFRDKVKQNAIERAKTDMTDKQVKSELVAEKLLNENTIRWRYSNSGNDEIIKQSNAHFVLWSDGSVSLKIGSEMFDFKQLPINDTFFVKTHDSYEILQNDAIINKSVNLIPTSTHTSTHRKLTQAVKNIQKKDKILNTITNDDPLLKQRLADENERKTLKLRRQLESKRRLQEERMDRGASPAGRYGGREEREPAYERFARTYGGDEYDEEDDFVANDDEEEEEFDEDEDEEEEFERGAERLKQLKLDGDAKYRSQEPEESKRKRRRIIDSDDDE